MKRIKVFFIKIIRFFGYYPTIKDIPEGMYCYELDSEQMCRKPLNGAIWVKYCKYYAKNTCYYIGFTGFDVCLYDQCKICGINEGIKM